MSEILAWAPIVANDYCKLTEPSSGKEYEEIYCIYPWLQAIYFEFELTWRPRELYLWMHANSWFPIACTIVYMAAIYLGQKYMEKREPYVMKKTLACWNLFLSAISVLMLTRMVPMLIHLVYTYGINNFLCMDPQNAIGASITGTWCMLFVWTKPAELFDTFFIVAHKKKLMLLHWYHHVTVLLCTWFTFTSHCPPGLIYSTVNLAVHAVMYFYYFLMAIKCKPKWFNPKWITVGQISQMVVGATVSVMSFMVVGKQGCWAKAENNFGVLIMYASYFVLFMQFFLKRYGVGIKMGEDKKKTA